MQVLRDSKPPKLPPLLLEGGYTAWDRFITHSGERFLDWVEIGEGCGRYLGGENVANGTDNSDLGIARSASDYVSE